MEETRNKTSWMQLVSIVVIALLTVEVALLIQQNRELKMALPPPPWEALKAGEQVEGFSVHTLDGRAGKISYNQSSKKYLLFVLSTTCPHCSKNLEQWNDIQKHNDTAECIILGISVNSVEKTRKYRDTATIGFQLVALADTSFPRRYKAQGYPQTILIKGNGVVEKSWIGELRWEQKSEIESLMAASKGVTNQIKH